jgi:hypothetical protein
MARVDTPKGNVRIVGIDAAKDQPIAQSAQHLAHPFAKEAGAWSEVFGRRVFVNGSVCFVEHFFHGLDLADENRIAQGSRRLVVHRMACQLASVAY